MESETTPTPGATPLKTREQIYEADQDWAITKSLELMKDHRRRADKMLYSIFTLFIVLILFLALPLTHYGAFPADKVIDYIMYGVCIVFISIFTSLYKQHSLDASKAENIYFSFLRVRVAGKSCGYGTEVRIALTDRVFEFTSPKESIFSKSKKIESPIPGHPVSDLSTKLVNEVFKKFLNTIEIKVKPEDEQEGDQAE